MRPCLKSTPSFTGTSSSSGGLSFSTLSSCTPSTSGSCLGTTPACQRRKCVAFEADACLETVFVADEWDRTPTEPARKLSYQYVGIFLISCYLVSTPKVEVPSLTNHLDFA
ncbi:hypothetical protein FA13DRAFT_1085419 [Coprinellus micaceus]|uniref:Uncharacterized protein n=1 Tax=Coprinellus micaceus TaxID=71717 RepID=A0A4Y7TRJ6_COPMI|nr:hypothetical protein FA13DRAFT_1085419 [Coprinellus micaceus]